MLRGLTRLRLQTMWLAVLAVAALWSAADLRAQLPLQPMGTIFEITGFIQNATLDTTDDPFSGGTLTVNNHVIVIPRYTIFQMPATALTWAELFTLAPAPYQSQGQTGLALSDTPKPDYTFEVTVQGNRLEPTGTYVAGLVFISHQSLQMHQGFISAINYSTGELTVGGSRVRLNDPIGRFGRVMTHDRRFTIDEDNPTVKSETGFPMCIPRTDPAVADDPSCPQGNRPSGQHIFTMPARPAPTATEIGNHGLTRSTPDPWRMAPFEVGDYVTVSGPIVKDAAGQYISAFAIDGNVGIFTTPGTQPAYVSIDLILMGTGPLDDVTIAQEGAKRTVAEGFSTDISAPIKISALDVNACTGEAVDRLWNIEAIDPGAPNGAVAGRWRFRPSAPLFDLKGFPFLPPTREVHVVSFGGTVTTLNGLSAGEYTAPVEEFILPENRGIGTPVAPGNFEAMAFLAQGSGPRGAAFTGQLSPWPGQTAPVRNACSVVSSDQTVKSGALVTLDGSQSVAANVPTGAVSFRWAQVSGISVALTNATTPSARFTAPSVALGATTALAFTLTVTPANGAPAVESRFVTVTVNNPDTIAPTVAAPTTNPNPPRKATAVTLTTTATDNAAVTAATFFYSYTLNGVKQTVAVNGTKSTTVANAWTATFPMPSVGGTYTYWVVASDAAGNQTTSAITTKSVPL